MTYDDSQDPRSGTVPASAFPPEQREADEAALMEFADVSRRALRLFAEPAWVDFSATCAKSAEQAYSDLRRAQRMEDVARAQGKLAVLEWIVSLPATEQKNLSNVMAKLETYEGGQDA